MERRTVVGNARQSGFAFLWVMVALAVMAVYAGKVSEVAYTQAQRDKELQLLNVGLAYQTAIRAYYQDARTPTERYPESLGDLVLDPRSPTPRRYLRKLYMDPMVQSAEWGLVRNAQQRIVGVYSLGPGIPLRQANFPDEFPGFAQQTSYRGWVFKYQPDMGLSSGRTR